MTAFEDGLWSRLVDEHDADHVVLPGAPALSRKRPVVIGVSLSTLAAAVTGVLALTAATGAPPAFALTRGADGGITVTINDLRSAIPALRARFAATGINETVVPVETDCRTSGRFAAAPLFVYAQEAPGAKLTFNPARVPAGYTGVLAAEQLPGGKVAMAEIAVEPNVPSCFPAIAFSVQNTADTTSIPTYLMRPVNSAPTDPGNGASRGGAARGGR